LRIPKLEIFARDINHQTVVISLLNYISFMEYQDVIAEVTGGKAMADVNRRFVACDCIEFTVNLCLGNWI
jgi:hypothetical protein